MIRGLYTAAAGMVTQQRKHDTITNNIANLNTPGFKQGNAVSRSFPEMLISLVNGGPDKPQAVTIGRLNTGVYVEEEVLTFAPGVLQQTDNPFDLAIVSDIRTYGNPPQPVDFDASGKALVDGEIVFQPQAFFTVESPDGQRFFTRNGKFFADADGQVVDANGNRLLLNDGQDGQPLVLVDPLTGEPLSSFRLSEDGILLHPDTGLPLTDANGEPMSLLITRVENPHLLLREGGGLFRLDEQNEADATIAVLGGEVAVRQGFVERSNVDAAQAMVDLMAALRAYESNQKVIQYYDRSLEKAVNEVGRV